MTQIALCTTTVHVPTAWAQAWRQALPDAAFYIAGDRKSEDAELAHLCRVVGNAHYYPLDAPSTRRYRCEPIIGPDSVSRRNLAVLEALRDGAEVIVCLDDDNWPLEDVAKGVEAFAAPACTGPVGQSTNGWLNIGSFAARPYTQRGLPAALYATDDSFYDGECTAPVGVLQGLVHGEPDVAAVERLVRAPTVSTYFVEDEPILLCPANTWTAINSQSTLWRRETAPLAFMLAGAGRYDDIWAGYIAQHVLSATDYVVGLGRPYVRQDRNTDHDLMADLDAELHGMRYTERFCAALRSAPLSPDAPILRNLCAVAEWLAVGEWPSLLDTPLADMPNRAGWTPRMREFLAAWRADVAEVLG